MATLLRVPEVATGSTEAVLTEWLVPENVAFEAGAAIAVLETDKAAVEVEAEAAAVLLRRLVDGGSTVEVGAPIAVLGVVGRTCRRSWRSWTAMVLPRRPVVVLPVRTPPAPSHLPRRRGSSPARWPGSC